MPTARVRAPGTADRDRDVGDRRERGAATIAAVGIVAVVVLVVSAVLPALASLAAGQRAANAADAAALAAADALSGAVAGLPCELARRAAELGGASLDECRLEGPVALVSVSAGAGVLVAHAAARAGPPGWEANAGAG